MNASSVLRPRQTMIAVVVVLGVVLVVVALLVSRRGGNSASYRTVTTSDKVELCNQRGDWFANVCVGGSTTYVNRMEPDIAANVLPHRAGEPIRLRLMRAPTIDGSEVTESVIDAATDAP